MIRNESADPVTAALDSGLRRMSEEVPEMPESFRRGWRQAVRAEAAAGNRGAETPEASAHAPVSPSGKRSAFRSAPLQRRILSVAAILLFVLGSVLVTGDLALLTRVRPTESAVSVNAPLSGAGSREQAPPVSEAADSAAEESPAADAPAQTSAVSAFSEKKAAALSLAQTAAPAGSAFEAAYESGPQEAEESAETRGEEASSDAAAAAGTVFGAALPTQPDAPDASEAEAPAAVIPEAPAAAVPEAEAPPAAVPAAGEASLPRLADPAGVSGPRPLRTAGFCLLGAGVLLAVLLLVFRKKG